jgi:effector-binding domain-containing protein
VQKLLITTGALIALLIIIGLALPRYSRIEVSTTIDANPATVFTLANDLQRANEWSSTVASDPNARVVFSGPQRGVGAMMTWDGAIAGSGTQTITESRPYEHVAMVVNPGEDSESRMWIDIRRGAGGSDVTWSFEADFGYNIVGRYLALMIKGIFKREFETALANLKTMAEGLPRADFSDLDIEHIVVEPTTIAYLSSSSAPEPGAISEAMGDAYFEILGFIDEHGLAEAGAPLSISRSFSGSSLQFDAAIPVRGVTDETPADGKLVRIGETYGGPVIRVRHIGSYRTLATTHLKITSYLAAAGIGRNGAPWESYVSDPTKVDEDDLLTYVFYPISR